MEKWYVIMKGLIKAVFPFLGSTKPQSTGGTSDSLYCYSTWLRHLILANNGGMIGIPAEVAELGPGDSLGTGIAALLSGSKKYYALDVYKYWDEAYNLRIFDELVLLFRNRTAVAGPETFPKLTPHLDSYAFPSYLLTDEIMSQSLAENRLTEIRAEIAKPALSNNYIHYFIPWNDPAVIKNDSLDFVYSQSVLQYIDMTTTYSAMQGWLKKGGCMAHVVDMSSLGITKTWNGHWTFSQLEWDLYSYGKKITIKRATLSDHLKYAQQYGFEVLKVIPYTKPNTLIKEQLADEFKQLNVSDLETEIAYIFSKKISNVSQGY